MVQQRPKLSDVRSHNRPHHVTQASHSVTTAILIVYYLCISSKINILLAKNPVFDLMKRSVQARLRFEGLSEVI
jgi:hypothetical protein